MVRWHKNHAQQKGRRGHGQTTDPSGRHQRSAEATVSAPAATIAAVTFQCPRRRCGTAAPTVSAVVGVVSAAFAIAIATTFAITVAVAVAAATIVMFFSPPPLDFDGADQRRHHP